MEIEQVMDLAVLGAQPLFSGISDEAKQHLVAAGVEVAFAEGAKILVEGESGETAYILVAGRVSVLQRERQVRDLLVGSVFGELSLLDGGPRTATIVAAEDSRCLAISRADLWALFEREPSVMGQVLKGLVNRLREHERPVDRLTGLPNQAFFEELLSMSLDRSVAEGSGVAVLHIGLDGFRLINEGLGSVEGDRILQEVGERFVRAVTGTVARAGNDEFLVLLTDIPVDSGEDDMAEDAAFIAADAGAHAIKDILAAAFTADEREVFLTASVGAAVYPRYSENATTLMRDAATAMQDSKRIGPGSHLVSTQGTSDPVGRLQLVTELRRAVEAKAWKLLYQPVVDLDDGRMVGVEALVRWDRDGEFVSPAVFIPLAEDLGLINEIGDWVMEESCRQSRAWRDAGLDLRISFNLSPRELHSDTLVTRLTDLLAEHEVPATRMVVEVTESSMESDPEHTRGILGMMAVAGLGVSIDDFGTGYSSLSRLTDMPVSTLKIDRSFVMDLPDREAAVGVVRAVIRLAESLGMTSLAEGIETDAQRVMLKVLGCKLAQGYFFGKPLSPEKIFAVHEQGGYPMGES